MKSWINSPAIFTIVFIYLVACSNLELVNPNNPSESEVISNSAYIEKTASELVNLWFQTTHSYNSPALGFWVAADAGTLAWGTAGSWVFGQEPREAFNNEKDYAYSYVNHMYYQNLYSILNKANSILGFLENTDQPILINSRDESPMVMAVAYFAQGLALGYLGLVYDRAFVVTHNTDIEAVVQFSPYSNLVSAAVSSFDQAIAVCSENDFIIPEVWVPLEVTLTSSNFAKLASSFTARVLAYSPRNIEQNNALDWQVILAYASNGIDYDFSPIADDEKWYSLYHTYANYIGWGQADMRIVNMLDPRMPSRWPGADGFNWILENVGEPISDINDTNILDRRIVTDFMPLSSCSFNPERGYYFFSNYRFKRRDMYLSTKHEPCPDFYTTENDLIRAEALLHLNRLSEAKEIIDNGTRVTRGGLPAVNLNKQDISDAIFYERNIELYCSGFGIEFFAMRKANKLQVYSFLHLPIPGAELEILGMPYYSFGAEQGVPGVDVSVGGWF